MRAPSRRGLRVWSGVTNEWPDCGLGEWPDCGSIDPDRDFCDNHGVSSRFDRAYLELTNAYAHLHDPAWLRPEPVDVAQEWDTLLDQQRNAREVARAEFGRYRQPVRNYRYILTDPPAPGATRLTARVFAVIGAALMWFAIGFAACLATQWVR